MKINQHLAVLTLGLSFLCGALTTPAQADEGHDHTQHEQSEKKAGPNGGRLITVVEPRAEFFLTADRFAQISFVDDHGEVVAPQGQVVSLIGGDRSDPVRLSFTLVDGVLRSTSPLPDKPNMPIVLSIKPTEDAKAVREKFYLNESECGGCDYQEYACICGH